MIENPYQIIQDQLQSAINRALSTHGVVTGWVASVNVLIEDEQKVVCVHPSGQAPALTTGILAHAKTLDKNRVESHEGYYDEEDENE